MRNEGGHQSWVLRNFDKCIGEEGWGEFVGQSVSVSVRSCGWKVHSTGGGMEQGSSSNSK